MKIKTVLAVAATTVSTAVVYELEVIGARALCCDVEYITKKEQTPPPKKQWWNRKKEV